MHTGKPTITVTLQSKGLVNTQCWDNGCSQGKTCRQTDHSLGYTQLLVIKRPYKKYGKTNHWVLTIEKEWVLELRIHRKFQ
jgi:hypothetical protein